MKVFAFVRRAELCVALSLVGSIAAEATHDEIVAKIDAVQASVSSLTTSVNSVGGTLLNRSDKRIALSSTNTPGTATSVFRITQSGSYYLAGNVVGQAGKHGILITTSRVTLDLNGFSVVGVPNSLSGIKGLGTNLDAINVRNGVVAGFSGWGVDLSSVIGCHPQDLHASSNTQGGFYAGGIAAPFTSQTLISTCTAESNGGKGFLLPQASVVTNCMARNNGDHGYHFSHGTLENCAASGNGGAGIYGGEASVIRGCLASLNLAGGIQMGEGGLVQNCSSLQNTQFNIAALNDCLIASNQCFANAGFPTATGILVTGSGNRVQSNSVTGHTTGISVTAGGNLVVQNSGRRNTNNFSVSAANSVGPILGLAFPIASNSPWANFGL